MANVKYRTGDFLAVPVDWVPLTLSSDVDLTDDAGPTSGYCARCLLVGSTAGNVKVDTPFGTARTIPVAANQCLYGIFTKVYSTANGTTAATITVGL